MSSLDCLKLQRLSSVEEVGWVAVAHPTELGNLPGLEYRTYRAGSGLFRLLGINESTLALGSIVIGERVAAETGLSKSAIAGIVQPAGLEAVGVAAVLPEESPKRLQRSILVPDIASPVVSECWAVFQTSSLNRAQELVRGLLGDDQVSAAQFEGPNPLEPLEELQARPSRDLPIFAGLLIGLVGWAVDWMRRSEFALQRVIGLLRSEVYLEIALRSVAVVLASISIGFALAVSTAGGSAAAATLGSAEYQAIRLLGVAMAMAAVSPAALRHDSLALQLKE